jgi:glycosyltransferase involved in cell wall biosynthesis
VIPVLNEEESLPELMDWIGRVMKENKFTYEVIMVDDGSTDTSWQIIQSLGKKYTQIKAIKFRRNFGKAAALNTAFKVSSGNVVVTMDADLQDSPEEISELHKMITQDGYDLVSGWKKKRYDPISKTIPTKFYNALTRKMSGIKLHDFNCGLKAYHNDVVHNIDVFGEMHRYIPVLAKFAGFEKIGEKVVQHQARKYGKSKYGLGRAKGVLDLLSITFMGRFGKKPMHLFGGLGTLIFFIGFIILLYLSISKLFWNQTGIQDRPIFYLGIVTLIVGSQLFLTGFLAEILIRNSDRKNEYQIADRIGFIN